MENSLDKKLLDVTVFLSERGIILFNKKYSDDFKKKHSKNFFHLSQQIVFLNRKWLALAMSELTSYKSR